MYLKWDEKTITNFSDQNIAALYNEGFIFTRRGKGVMYQTRSVRIDLSKFSLSSENRRVLKKSDELQFAVHTLPYSSYHWSIAKLAKDFYETKFGKATFSANKMKEVMTDSVKSNFNRLFIYTLKEKPIGYCIAFETNDLLHYCYPFYDLNLGEAAISNVGLGMMLRAMLYAKEQGKKYIYLGSASRPTDTYKLQFEGLEWWNGVAWQINAAELKKILTERI